MKKIIMVGLLLGSLNFAHAISAPSGMIGTSVLDGANAYLWNPGVTAANINSARLTFTGIIMTSSPTGQNKIWVDFGSFVGISSVAVGGGTTIGTPPTSGTFNFDPDADTAGDAYAAIPDGSGSGKQTYLGTQLFPTQGGVGQTWFYDFTAAQLTALNSYISAGAWGFEIDPDCHFTVGGIDFVYTQGTPSVPDTAATFGLLGLATVGLLAFRRKVCLN